MRLQGEYSVSLICQVLDLPRSSFYYQPAQQDDSDLEKAIEKVAAAWPTYGYRRVTKQLHREGWRVNHKVVQAKMKEEEVDLSEYSDFADAWWQLGHFIDEVYMHKRIHSSLGYLTPSEFESQWLK